MGTKQSVRTQKILQANALQDAQTLDARKKLQGEKHEIAGAHLLRLAATSDLSKEAHNIKLSSLESFVKTDLAYLRGQGRSHITQPPATFLRKQ
jgi:hypothetical protein